MMDAFTAAAALAQAASTAAAASTAEAALASQSLIQMELRLEQQTMQARNEVLRLERGGQLQLERLEAMQGEFQAAMAQQRGVCV